MVTIQYGSDNQLLIEYYIVLYYNIVMFFVWFFNDLFNNKLSYNNMYFRFEQSTVYKKL